MGFRRTRVDVALGDRAPPFSELMQRFFTSLALPHQITTYCGACSSNPSPTMEIDLPPSLQGGVYRIQNGLHLLWRWQAKIADGEAVVLDLNFMESCLLQKDAEIGN